MRLKFLSIFNFDLITYLVVGAIVFIFYFIVLFITIDKLKIYYPIGVSLSYFMSVLAHFFFNRTFTFRGGGLGSFKSQLIKYIFLVVANYFISITIVAFVVEKLFYSPYTGATVGIAVTTITGYFASKYWIFRRMEF